ncbi:hypothetical protein J5X98_19270 [Leptothermofonsia sichuanensis E412]|uniref:DUF6882 domain-containing protein n=1 Tax=Leptothermofonsia sichuanensis TaxID=2917832 RepID=UPI001CA6813C|nr:DUF6882 domain-containing protein [Leptothermofonsia sichuanensis]QZZ19484.1 hypothetical protein J5X98_19270 [Leptothermofonsia sichuanensis E412]
MNPEPPAYPILLARSMEELHFKTQAQEQLWLLGQCNWEVDQEQGSIRFTNPRGQIITAPVQIIGTYNTLNGTWLWGWDHPSVVPALQNHASTLHDYGKAQGIDRLTTRNCTVQNRRHGNSLPLPAASAMPRGPIVVRLAPPSFS